MNAEVIATVHPSDRLAAFLRGGGLHLGLDEADLAKVATTWARFIVAEWSRKAALLQAIEARAQAKYTAAAWRDINAAFAKHTRWVLAQRKGGNEVEARRAAQRRDQKLVAAIAGLIISLKFV